MNHYLEVHEAFALLRLERFGSVSVIPLAISKSKPNTLRPSVLGRKEELYKFRCVANGRYGVPEVGMARMY